MLRVSLAKTVVCFRKIDSQNVTSVFCCIKNWRRQLIGTKARNLRKKSSSTFCVCFSCAPFFTLVHSYRSLPFCSGQHCKGGFTLPESSSTKVCHLRAGSCDNSVVECIHWDARSSHEKREREFTNMAAHRTARTQEECTNPVWLKMLWFRNSFHRCGKLRYARSLTPQQCNKKVATNDQRAQLTTRMHTVSFYLFHTLYLCSKYTILG